MTKQLNTTQLAEELGIERSLFVKHRSRYEAKLIQAGYLFEKQGTRQKLVYLFTLEEDEIITLETRREKIKRIFNIDVENRAKTFERYIKFVAENTETFGDKTDAEVAELIGEYPSNLSFVRKKIQDIGLLTADMEEPKYFKAPIGSQQWEEITKEEYNSVMSNIYYPTLNALKAANLKIVLGNEGEEREVNAYQMAWKELGEKTGYRYTKRQHRTASFPFLTAIEQYLAK